MPDLKTVDQVRAFITGGGVGSIESKIEKAFSRRLYEFKKISLLASVVGEDAFLRHVIVSSILVDCRALFFGKPKAEVVFGGKVEGLLFVLAQLIDDYEVVVSTFGKNRREQIDLIVSSMTGRPKAD